MDPRRSRRLFQKPGRHACKQ